MAVLQAIHKCNIVWHDLKPDNCLLTKVLSNPNAYWPRCCNCLLAKVL